MRLFLLVLGLLFNQYYCDETVETTVEDDESTPSTGHKKLEFTVPKIPPNYFVMYFDSPSNLADNWILSEAKKEGVEEVIAKYNGIWSVEVPQTSAINNDYGLVLKSKARHAAIAAKLSRPFDFSAKQFVVQYEVKFQNGMECGGAYIKLLSDIPNLDLKQFHDKTLYTIMFGPDKCGNENKLHFIFQHKHPKTGKYDEKHSKKPNADMDRNFSDKKSHLYTLVLNSDNTFEIYIDQTLVNSGGLLKDVEPAVNPTKEIDDPDDKKPSDWDDRAKIADPVATKPDDWDEDAPEYIEDLNAVKPDTWLEDEPLTVSDEKAEKPKDWDDEMDGEWEPPRVDNPKCKDAQGCGPWKAPKIKNPKYKGTWSAPMIDNPSYKGVWSPKKIPNPDYFEDQNPYHMTSIGGIGLELWSMSDEIVFDNFLIVDSKKAADDFAAETWILKKDAERRADPNAQSVVDAIREATSERPWLWIVIILVIVLPIVLIVIYCCRSGSNKEAEYARMAREMHKKDDDIVIDDDDEVDHRIETGDSELEKESGAPEHLVEGAGDELTPKGDLESDPDNDSLSKGRSSSDSAGHSPSQEKTARKRRARKE